MLSDLLTVRELRVSFHLSGQNYLMVMDRVDFRLSPREKVAMMGESGCGKSVFASALLGLLPPTAMVSGEILFQGNIPLLTLSETEINRLRGNHLVLIPQNPTSQLNPTLRVGYQIKESLIKKQGLPGREAKKISRELLSRVGFKNPEKISRMYPHQLSGGMAQRLLLAIGLSGKAEMIVADEPTRGLDSESQHQFLQLIDELYGDSALLMITHQLEVAACCDRILIMYGGEIVESGPAHQVINHPRHPYTRGLLNSHPDNGMCPIPGRPFSFTEMSRGCRFCIRCSDSDAQCIECHPSLLFKSEYGVRCHHVTS